MNASAIAMHAGIVGAGGAGFPTHVKLAANAACFIVNAAECEPLIEVDKFLIRTRAYDLVSGSVKMAEAVNAKELVFAIKKTYIKEIEALSAAIEAFKKSVNSDAANKSIPEISLHYLRSFYPAGDEQLIAMLKTGRTVPERGIPLDIDAIVDNVATVLNYFDACNGKPVTHRVLSVTGAIKNPLILRVPVGTPIRDCIEAAGGAPDGSGIISGGPMMGMFYDLSEADKLFVKKTDGNILVLPNGHKLGGMAKLSIQSMRNRARSACIGCRICTDLCPRYLSGHDVKPHIVMRNFFRVDKISDDAEFEKAFGSALNCCECGVCENYACPMMLSPRRINVSVKPLIRERGINPERNMSPVKRNSFDDRLVPAKRLTARLGLTKYVKSVGDDITELFPASVCLSLKQQIGAACVACVLRGDQVAMGDIIAKPPEGKLGAILHSSIDGKVVSVDDEAITIKHRHC